LQFCDVLDGSTIKLDDNVANPQARFHRRTARENLCDQCAVCCRKSLLRGFCWRRGGSSSVCRGFTDKSLIEEAFRPLGLFGKIGPPSWNSAWPLK
jgi:hypothetical protein